MIQLHDIRYVRMGTRDLEATNKFATGIIGLQLAGKDGKWAYFRSDKVATRGDTRDHTLAYFEGDPNDHTVGFELKNPGDLDQVGAQLDNANYPARLGTREECEQRRVAAFIATQDPTGNKIEIVARPYYAGTRYFPGRDAGITEFSHIGLNTTNPQRDEKFWTTVFNARVSDWLGDTPLLRINTAHHSVVLFPTTRRGVILDGDFLFERVEHGAIMLFREEAHDVGRRILADAVKVEQLLPSLAGLVLGLGHGLAPALKRAVMPRQQLGGDLAGLRNAQRIDEAVERNAPATSSRR